MSVAGCVGGVLGRGFLLSCQMESWICSKRSDVFFFKKRFLIRGRVLKKHIVLFEWRKNTSAIICPRFPASLVAFLLLKTKSLSLPCTLMYCNVKVRELTDLAGQASGCRLMLMHAGRNYVKGKWKKKKAYCLRNLPSQIARVLWSRVRSMRTRPVTNTSVKNRE